MPRAWMAQSTGFMATAAVWMVSSFGRGEGGGAGLMARGVALSARSQAAWLVGILWAGGDDG